MKKNDPMKRMQVLAGLITENHEPQILIKENLSNDELEELIYDVIPTLDNDEVELYANRYGLDIKENNGVFKVYYKKFVGEGNTLKDAMIDFANHVDRDLDYKTI